MASEIRVNQIQNRSGLTTTTLNDQGVVVVVIVTANSFSGDGSGLTDLPAGNLTGTVADARISSLTASKLSGALPAIDGSNLTGINTAFGNSSVNSSGIATFSQVKTLNGTSSLNKHSV